jgi:hypothetical protein
VVLDEPPLEEPEVDEEDDVDEDEPVEVSPVPVLVPVLVPVEVPVLVPVEVPVLLVLVASVVPVLVVLVASVVPVVLVASVAPVVPGGAGGAVADAAGGLEVALGRHVEVDGGLGEFDGGAGVVDIVDLGAQAGDAGLVAEVGGEGLIALGAAYEAGAAVRGAAAGRADAAATSGEGRECGQEHDVAHGACHGMALYSTRTTSYSRSPLGSLTMTSSPLRLPSMARAMGAEIEILPLEASDSSSPTMW